MLESSFLPFEFFNSDNKYIKLKAGMYSGSMVINFDRYQIVSDVTKLATIADPRPPPPNRGLNFTIVINADNVTLRNLKFTGKHAISLRINGDNCTLENLIFEDVMMAFVASGKNLRFKNITIRRFSEDGLRLAGDGFYGENIRIEDLYAASQEAHHDGIQLYAGKPGSPLRSAERFEGRHALNKGTLKNVSICSTTDIQRDHVGQLQGIFSADGFMDGLHLEDIQIETHNCLHGITLRGLRTAPDGTPSCLKSITVQQTPGGTGQSPRINLLPARRLAPIRDPALLPPEPGDEAQLYDLLFPPDIFRTEEAPADPEQRPGPPLWQDVANGEQDELQQRIVNYEPLLELVDAPLFQRLHV